MTFAQAREAELLRTAKWFQGTWVETQEAAEFARVADRILVRTPLATLSMPVAEAQRQLKSVRTPDGKLVPAGQPVPATHPASAYRSRYEQERAAGSKVRCLDCRHIKEAHGGEFGDRDCTFDYCDCQHGRYEGQEVRQPSQPASPTPARPIQNGTYSVVQADGSYVTVEVQAHWSAAEAKAGLQVARFLSGPDNGTDFTGFAFITPGGVKVWRKFQSSLAVGKYVAALGVIAAGTDEDRAAAGEAYALRSSRCCRCQRKLTVPVSIHRGMGPRCAEGGQDE